MKSLYWAATFDNQLCREKGPSAYADFAAVAKHTLPTLTRITPKLLNPRFRDKLRTFP
jgi:hypothetical protein